MKTPLLPSPTVCDEREAQILGLLLRNPHAFAQKIHCPRKNHQSTCVCFRAVERSDKTRSAEVSDEGKGWWIVSYRTIEHAKHNAPPPLKSNPAGFGAAGSVWIALVRRQNYTVLVKIVCSREEGMEISLVRNWQHTVVLRYLTVRI